MDKTFLESIMELKDLVFKLNPAETLIAIEYLKKLIDSRPKSPAVACKVVPIDKELEYVRKSQEPSYSEQLQDELEPLPNSNLKYAV